jgi:hypothetical protein
VLRGIALLLFSFFGFAYLFDYLGWAATFNKKSVIILCIAAGGLICKIMFTDKGDFSFHKHGLDLCLVATGGVLSAVSVQLFEEGKDLYPGFANIDWLQKALSGWSGQPGSQRSVMFFLVLALSFLCASITSWLAREAPEHREQTHYWPIGRNFLELLAYVVGLFMLGVYISLLISKP